MRTATLLAALALTVAPAPAQTPTAPPKADPMKLPALDAPEWKKQPSGLEIWDVKEGTGEPAKKDATVGIHYTGWTTDGNIFDSSVTRKARAVFPLKSLIKGWQEGIPGMKPGGVRRLKIPGELAYGAAGRPPKIPANATLVFEIEYYGDPMLLPELKGDGWKPLGDGSTGIRVNDVRVGEGAEVKPGATVSIHYTGWTTAGKVFDSSLKGARPNPATFPLTDLIKGWQVAVPGMKPGGIRRMELPADYAYGQRGSPPDIAPGATLIFEIELIK